MTITDTPTDAPEAARPVPATAGGLAGVLGNGDHKTTGRLFIGGGLALLLASLAALASVGFERVSVADLELFGNANDVLRLSSFGWVGLVLLGVLPLWIGIGLVVVPLQVGATSVALPRAAAGAFWGWLFGAGLFCGAYAVDGGFFGTAVEGVELSILALGMVLASLLVATVSVVTTAIALRSPGMSMSRLPLFSWSMLVAGSVWILSLPALGAGLAFAYVDHRYGPLGVPQLGGVPLGSPDALFFEVSWLFSAPQLFSFAIPALGVALEVLPVFFGSRTRFRNVLMGGVGVFSALTFGAWAQPFFAPPNEPVSEEVLSIAFALPLVLPLLLVLAAAADAAARGKVRLGVPVLGSLLSILVLVGAAAVNVVGLVPDLELHGTSYETGLALAVLLASLVAAAAALQYWAPKIWGGLLSEGVGVLGILAIAGGAAVAGGADIAAGFSDQPVLHLSGETVRDGVEALNAAGLAGVAMAAAGLLLVMFNALRATASAGSEEVADDPWSGHTLEWATSSPPPPDNFAEVALVTSGAPLLDARSPEDES